MPAFRSSLLFEASIEDVLSVVTMIYLPWTIGVSVCYRQATEFCPPIPCDRKQSTWKYVSDKKELYFGNYFFVINKRASFKKIAKKRVIAFFLFSLIDTLVPCIITRSLGLIIQIILQYSWNIIFFYINELLFYINELVSQN